MIKVKTLPLLNVEQSRNLDHQSISEGFSSQQLIGQAALATYFQLQLDHYLPTQHAIYFLCGGGNNGADGLALAWHLANSLISENKIASLQQIKIFSASTDHFYAQACQKIPLTLFPVEEFLHPSMRLEAGSLVIDALLGTGSRPPLRYPFDKIIRHLSTLQKDDPSLFKLIALDSPTGVFEHESDEPYSSLPFCDHIYSFGPHKLHLALKASIHSSTMKSLNIGFPFHLLAAYQEDKQTPQLFPFIHSLSDDELKQIKKSFLKKPIHHKYTAGSGMIIGGSPGMEGALLLSSQAFMASGGGICFNYFPQEESRKLFLQQEPSSIYHSFHHTHLHNEIKKIQGVLIGPGLSLCKKENQAAFDQLFHLILTELEKRDDFFVIGDAGFLTHYQNYWQQFKKLKSKFQSKRSQILLTPHRGELKQMGFSFHHQADELKELKKFSQELACSILVKDAVSVLVSPSAEDYTYVWKQTAPGLAVAGSGDVLGGILLAHFTRAVSTDVGAHHWAQAQIIFESLVVHLKAAEKVTHPTSSLLIEGIRNFLS